MSTPEQPATPPLTRRQLREIRNTGANPVIPPTAATTADEPVPEADSTDPRPEDSHDGASAAADSNGKGPKGSTNGAHVAPLPRPAQPVSVPPPPIADAAVDLGVSPLTRRQARQQERIRTASVPVITPEVVAAHAGGHGASPAFAPPSSARAGVTEAPDTFAPTEAEHAHGADEAQWEPADSASVDSGSQEPLASSERDGEDAAGVSPWAEPAPAGESDSAPDAAEDADQVEDDDRDGGSKAVVSPLLGAGLLGGGGSIAEPVLADLPPSFDQLLSRSNGAVSTPNALIVSQSPEVAPLVGPVTATGEVLITGTFNLPEGLGSTGHAKGTADGKEIDATLIDGELPSHSSPTPIAASAAVSTVKMPGEVIKPPAPEKGSRLMMSLAITAGVLALALVGVLILAFVTGVF
jgi:hypothetical protein